MRKLLNYLGQIGLGIFVMLFANSGLIDLLMAFLVVIVAPAFLLSALLGVMTYIILFITVDHSINDEIVISNNG